MLIYFVDVIQNSVNHELDNHQNMNKTEPRLRAKQPNPIQVRGSIHKEMYNWRPRPTMTENNGISAALITIIIQLLVRLN